MSLEIGVGLETELKLRLDPAGLRRLRRHPMVQALKLGRPLTRLQKSVYFDTEAFLLRRQEMVLRVRHIGRRRLQTVKTSGACIGGAWARDEWENEITGDFPELALLADTPLAALFTTAESARALRPVFTTEVTRTIYLLGADDWQVELALDEGQVVAAQGSMPIAEAELELKAGAPHRLFELALALQADLPARVMTATKSSRGYQLAEGRKLKPQKGGTPALAETDSAATAFQAIVQSCLGQLLTNQDCLLETRDPEAVHQMRVALRRLRSAMNIFKDLLVDVQTAQIKDELRWLGTILGPARDCDVFIAEILTPLATDLAEEAGFPALEQDFQQRKLDAYAHAIASLETPRFTRLMLTLGHWSHDGDWLTNPEPNLQTLREQPAPTLAAQILERRYRKVIKDLKNLSKLDSAHRHAARIEVKKLRYAVEFFEILFEGKRARKFAAALAQLQDRLGLLNDIAVAHNTLKSWAEDSNTGSAHWIAGLIAGLHAARIPELLETAESSCKDFRAMTRFWHAPALTKQHKAPATP